MTTIKPTPGEEAVPEREYQSESFNTLKAWVHWVLKNPIDEHQEAHAKATNDLFALLGTRDAQLARAEARLAQAEERIKELEKLCAIKDGLYDGKKDQVRWVQAREQRLIEAFEGLVEKFRKAEANCMHGSITYKQAAEWALAALVEAKGEKG